MTADPRTGSEASDLGRFEPSPYDFGITDNPEPVSYSLTAAAEAALPGFREIEAAFAAAEEDYGPQLQVPTSDTRPAASLSRGQLRDGADHQDAGAHR